jgi:hypothetical protein
MTTSDVCFELSDGTEVCVEPDGSVLAWDSVGHIYSRRHSLDAEQTQEASRKAQGLRNGTMRVSAGFVYPLGLKALVERIQDKLRDEVAKVTLNKGPEAYNDLDNVASLARNAKSWLEDSDADYGSDATEDPKSALDDMLQQIDDARRAIDDDGYLDDDINEDAFQEVMEDTVGTLEEAIEDLRRNFS